MQNHCTRVNKEVTSSTFCFFIINIFVVERSPGCRAEIGLEVRDKTGSKRTGHKRMITEIREYTIPFSPRVEKQAELQVR